MKRPNIDVALFCNTSAAMLAFRGGVIQDMLARGEKVVAIAAPDGVSEQKLRDMGAQFEPVPLSRSGTNPLAEIWTACCLLIILIRRRPRLLVSYTIKPNIYSPPLARLLGIPCVAVVTGLGYSFLSGTWVASVSRYLLVNSLSLANHVWFLNQDDKDTVSGSRAGLARRSSVLPGEGIDTSRYTVQPMPVTPVKFLLIARMLADKGVREYIQAARTICEKYPNIEFNLLGPIDTENPAGIFRQEIDQMAKHPQITYFGTTEDVRPFIADAHCVVLPSYREGLPMVLLESAAMGRPLIASDAPGCHDVIVDGVTGLVCKTRDSASLAACCEKFIIMSDAERQEMGEAARKDIILRFDNTIIFSHYHKMLARLGLDS